MKNINKKIVSLLLVGALTTSVLPTVANAKDDGEIESIANFSNTNKEENTIKLYYMKGIYTVLVGDKPVYVYLDNLLVNEYLPKNEAIELMGKTFKETFLMAKKVKNSSYVQGVSSSSEEYRTIYAISLKGTINNAIYKGWTKVDKSSINDDTMVATTVELGDFLAKDVDLSVYPNNMLGFGNVDINGDGVTEVVYFGNNKSNITFATKEDAVKYAYTNKLYYHVKSLLNITTLRQDYVIYALSDKAYVPGWTRINKDQLPKDAKIQSNTEYSEMLYVIDYNKGSLSEEVLNIQMPNEISYNYLKKEDALKFASKNYSSSYILTKPFYKPDSNEVYILYAFSHTPYVNDWTIIENDFIDSNSCIFLTMQDAYDFEAELNNSYSKTLKK